MLSRRYIRIKVMQALYAFFQGDSKDIGKGEKEMFSGMDKLYELYHMLLLLLVEIRFNAGRAIEDAKNKMLPTEHDLNPNMRLVENTILKKLESNKTLKKFANDHKLSWQNEGELTRRILANIRAGETYKKYMSSPEHTFREEQEFILDIYKEHICDYELLENFMEERSIFWYNDLDYVNSMVIKTLEGMSDRDDENTRLMPLYKNREEDTEFASELFRKTVVHDEENQKLIGEKTKNWEVERIAMMDVLLMKMAITEILYFQTVPVKVSLNEYIEVSKMFSTPKSKVFINGILDKLVLDFKSSGRLQKVGRGLLE
jgi:transcription antitermination protein NusB